MIHLEDITPASLYWTRTYGSRQRRSCCSNHRRNRPGRLQTPDETLKDRLLNSFDEVNISIATTERPWSFEGDGDAFKLAVEAKTH
jgi:hypothetical protein